MKNIILATTLFTALASTPALADNQQTTPSVDIASSDKTPSYVGVGSGALFGAVVGGPIGAIVGSLFGALIIEDSNQDKHIAALSSKNAVQAQLLAQQDAQIDKFEEALVQTDSQQSFTQVSEQQSFSPVIPELMTHIQFLSGSHDIAQQYYPQLDLMVDLLAQHKDWLVTIKGFADLRGSYDENLALSHQRAIAVKQYLSEGLTKRTSDSDITANIMIKGLGEVAKTNELDTAREDLFFDRRATINIQPASPSLLAQQ